MDRSTWRFRAIAITLALGCALIPELGAQSSIAEGKAGLPKLGDTVGVLMAVAADDGFFHGAPRLVPATVCYRPSETCRRLGYWQLGDSRGRALLDTVESLLPKRNSPAVGRSPLFARMELTAPVFFGPQLDSARIEVGIRARIGEGRRANFASDTHVVVARDSAAHRWVVVRRFTHRIT